MPVPEEMEFAVATARCQELKHQHAKSRRPYPLCRAEPTYGKNLEEGPPEENRSCGEIQ